MKTFFIAILLFIGLGISNTNAVTVNVSTDLSPIFGSEGGAISCSGESCEIENGVDAVQEIMGAIIKYTTFLVGLLAVLFIVWNGIMYSMGGAEQSLKEDAKKNIQKTLIGIIILLLSGTILNVIAPWIYR